MIGITLRELRRRAGEWLRDVKAGAIFDVTNRDRPVAVLAPLAKGGGLARLFAAGRARPARADLLGDGTPLSPRAGVATPSRVLEQMRADER